ncbi:Major facilitator superfamily [Trinorchestia longiramus]|nr:Major facilitator superfamily [Trinorchestia longiramus]
MRGQNYIQPLDSNESVPISGQEEVPGGMTANGSHIIAVHSTCDAPNDRASTLVDGLMASRTDIPYIDGVANNHSVLEEPLSAIADPPFDPNDATQSMLEVTDGILPMTISEELETKQEKKLRKQSHIVIYFTAFIMSIGFSIVMTSVWPYLKQLDNSASKVFYGFVIAINPLGQLLAAPLLGWWGNKAGSNRTAFLISVFFYVLGNVMYAMLRLMSSTLAAYALMASRFVVGVGSANIAVCRSYIAASTTLGERSTAMSYVAAAQSIGLIIGPAIQTALAVAIPVKEVTSSNVTTSEDASYVTPLWDLYTAAGWIAALLGLINFILFMPCLYKEVNIAAREAQMSKRLLHNSTVEYPKPDLCGLFVLLINFFFVLFLYVLLETIVVPMGKDLYAWSSEFAIKVVGIGLSVIGILAFFMFFLCSVLCNYIDERKVYIGVGLVPLVLAMIIHFPVGSNYPLMQNCTPANHTDEFSPVPFSTPTLLYSDVTSAPLDRVRRKTNGDHFFADSGTERPTVMTAVPAVNSSQRDEKHVFMSYFPSLNRQRRAIIIDDDNTCNAVGCPVSQEWCLYTPIIEIPQLIVANVVGVIGYPVAFSLTSSLFSKMIGPSSQGVWMGLMTSTGSLSRMSGPIFVTWIYSSYGTRWTFGILTVILVGSLILSLVFYKRLVPMDYNKNKPPISVSIVS